MRNLRRSSLFVALVGALAVVSAGCQPRPQRLSTSVVPEIGGSVSPPPGMYQGKIDLLANPAQHYKFVAWAGDASGNTNPLTVTMDKPKQIVAQFDRNKVLVQITSNPPEGGTVRPPSGEYDAGSTINLSATPADGYRFRSWGGDASGNENPQNVPVPDNPMVITGNFIRVYPLSVAAADPKLGTIIPTPSQAVYDAGSIVTLTATPNFPCAFQKWDGADNNATNPTTVTMNAGKSVSVSFVKLTPKPPPPIQPIQKSGNTHGIATIPIILNESEWVDGTIHCDDSLPAQSVYIQGPDGKRVQDLGRPGLGHIQFQASSAGTYTVVVEANPISTWGTNYDLAYTIYGLQ